MAEAHPRTKASRLSQDLQSIQNTLSRRLSEKQRQSFDWIVSHGYRSPESDSYDIFESEIEKKHKISLVLNRRLSNRPTPYQIESTLTNNENDPHESSVFPHILVRAAKKLIDQIESNPTTPTTPKSASTPIIDTIDTIDPIDSNIVPNASNTLNIDNIDNIASNSSNISNMDSNNIENIENDRMDAIESVPRNTQISEANYIDLESNASNINLDQVEEDQILSLDEKKSNLDWRYGQRAKAEDLVGRGIVSNEYFEVIRGDRDIIDAQAERARKIKETSEKMNKMFEHKLRPSADDVELRGLAPKGTLTPLGEREFEEALQQHEQSKQVPKQKLQTKYEQRMQPDEAIARNIIESGALEKDYDEVLADKRQERIEIESKLNAKYDMRPDPHELYPRGITKDSEELFEDFHVVNSKISADRTSRLEALSSWNRPKPDEMIARGVPLVAHNPLAVDVDAYEDAQQPFAWSQAASPSKKSRGEKINDIDKFFKTRASGMDPEAHRKDVAQRGVVPMGYWDDPELATQQQQENRLVVSDALSKRLDPKQRLTPEEMHARGFVSYNVRDKALEKDESNDNIGETLEQFIKAAKQETFLDRMRKEQEQIRRDLEKRHRRRPSQQDLEDRGVVPKGYWQAQEAIMVAGSQGGVGAAGAGGVAGALAPTGRRGSVSTQVGSWFIDRPDIAHVLAKGLSKAGYIEYDERRMAKELFQNGNGPEWLKRKDIAKVLNKRLHHKRRPSAKDLEDRGIIPRGYFTDLINPSHNNEMGAKQLDSNASMVVAIRGKHTRKLTAEKQIAGFLNKRKDPWSMLQQGILTPEQYANITGDTSVLVQQVLQQQDDEPQQQQSQMQQIQQPMQTTVYTRPSPVAGMSVAAVMGRQMMNREEKMQAQQEETETEEDGIGRIVQNYTDSGGVKGGALSSEWISYDVYESTLTNLEFVTLEAEIMKTITFVRNDNGNNNNISLLNELYQLLENLVWKGKEYGVRIGNLSSEKKSVLNKMNEHKENEEKNLEILEGLVKDHVEIENRIRPQMKAAYQKMSVIEGIVNKKLSNDEKRKLEAKMSNNLDNLDNNSFNSINASETGMGGHSAAFENMVNDLIFYEKYCFELNNMFVTMDSIRKEYKVKIQNAMSEYNKLEEHLNLIERAILNDTNEMRDLLFDINGKLNALVPSVRGNDGNRSYNEMKMSEDVETFKNLKELENGMNKRENRVESQLKLLEFSMQTSKAPETSRKLIEMSQLSFIYNSSDSNKNSESEKLKLFFEYFIKIAIQYFMEMEYAYNCFKNNVNTNEITKLQSISYLAEITPAEDYDNSEPFESLLFSELTYFVKYLNMISKLSSSGGNDYESVIFHVSRYLTGVVYSREILKRDELDIAPFANGMVKQWISNIIKCFELEHFSNNNNNNYNNGTTPSGPESAEMGISGIKRDRNLVMDCRDDPMVQVSASHAAAMVIDYVYNVRVVG